MVDWSADLGGMRPLLLSTQAQMVGRLFAYSRPNAIEVRGLCLGIGVSGSIRDCSTGTPASIGEILKLVVLFTKV